MRRAGVCGTVGGMEDADSTSPAATTAPPSGEPEAGPRWDSGERYVLIERLGAGGMGVVWAAYDRRLDRKVALKLLHDRYLGEADQARLAHEARAMARLAHPNVVPVFDVGEREGRTFLTMEFVRGQSLAEYLGTPRAWREIVEVFAAVARGLAAAHAAGLVHRDVKPGNILLGDDGRARIADFGVSRADPVDGETPPASARPAETQGLIGSPAYMAPEQLRGERADARSDQFGLCVALYEALAGTRPFNGIDPDQQCALIERGPPPLVGDLPSWLPPIVTRGLAADAAARFPSMDALADALAGPAPSRRWWPLAGAAAVAAVAGGVMIARGGAGGVTAPPLPNCDAEASAAFATAWSPARRDAMLAGFAAAGAAAEGQRIADAVEQQAAAWRSQHAASCRATRIDHTWTPDLGVLSLDCLGERRQYLGLTVDAITLADRAAVERGYDLVVQGLPSEPCGDPDFLRLRVPPPRDAAGQAARDAADAPLDALSLALNLDRLEEVEADLPAIIAAVERGGDPHQRASLLHLRASLAQRKDDLPAAIALNKEAYLLARRHRDAGAATSAASNLVWLLGFVGDDFAAAEDWAAIALVEIESAPMSEPAIGAHQAAGALAERKGDGPRAVAHQEQALAITRRHYGPRHFQTANALVNLAAALAVAGRTDDAIAGYRVALPIVAEAWGERLAHAHALSYFATVLDNSGATDEAVEVHDRALALGRRLGATGLDLAGLLGNHGNVLFSAGRYQEAIEHLTRAHALYAEAGRAGDAALALNVRGSAHAALAVERGDRALERLAIADLTGAARVLEAEWGANHPELAHSLTVLALLHLDRGRCADATPPARRAVAIYETDPARVATSDGLIVLGRCALEAARTSDAVPLLERAARLRHDHEPDPLLVAEADAWLGLALLPGDAARARDLLVTARTRLATAPTRFAGLLARVDAALAAR